MYIASEKGLFERDFVINTYKLLSDKSFKNIGVHNNSIFGNNQDLWKINLLDLKIENFESNVVNFSISGDFIWLNHFNYCELSNINTHRSWNFDSHTGIPGSVIYNIKSNDDRVWFMTNDGIGIYDWDQSDYE